MRQATFSLLAVVVCSATICADTFDTLKHEAVNRRRLIIWDDDGCDMTQLMKELRAMA